MGKNIEPIKIVREKDSTPEKSQNSPSLLKSLSPIGGSRLVSKLKTSANSSTAKTSLLVSMYFTIPCLILILCSWTEILGIYYTDIARQVLAIIVVLFGIPLSIAFRVDQLSLELSNSYSKETVLLIATLIMSINVFMVSAIRNWLKSFGKKK